MANPTTITATNSIFMLSIPNLSLFATPIQLQGFATDDAFATESVEAAQIVIGVDGFVSAGFIPVVTPQTISLMADSNSAYIFEQWMAAQKSIQELYAAQGTIILPSIQRKYTMNQGYLTGFPAISDVKKTLQARNFKITWGYVDVAPYI